MNDDEKKLLDDCVKMLAKLALEKQFYAFSISIRSDGDLDFAVHPVRGRRIIQGYGNANGQSGPSASNLLATLISN
jgi:hypothetical protein